MRKNTLALLSLAAMAAPVDKADKATTPTSPAAPEKTPPAPSLEEQLAAATARIAELEATVEIVTRKSREQSARFQTSWDEREKEFKAAHERLAGEVAARPRGVRVKGEVLLLRAKHGLRYSDAQGKAQRVSGGKEFRATLEELADDGLVEGDAFVVIGG